MFGCLHLCESVYLYISRSMRLCMLFFSVLLYLFGYSSSFLSAFYSLSYFFGIFIPSQKPDKRETRNRPKHPPSFQPSFQHINRPTRGDNTIQTWKCIKNSGQNQCHQRRSNHMENTYSNREQLETITLEQTDHTIGTIEMT